MIGSFLLPVHSEHCAFQRIAVSIDLFNADTGNRFRRIDIFNGLFAFFHRQLIFAVVVSVISGFKRRHRDQIAAVDFHAFQLIAGRCVNRSCYIIRSLRKIRCADQCVADRLRRAGYALGQSGRGDLERTDFNRSSRDREVEGLSFSLFVLIGQNSGFVQRNVDAVAVCACHNRRVQFYLISQGCAARHIRAGVPVDGFAGDIHRGLRRSGQRTGGIQYSRAVRDILFLGNQVNLTSHDVGNCTVVDDPQNGVQNIVEDAAEVSTDSIVVFAGIRSDVLQTFYLSGKANRIQLKVSFVAVFDGSRTVFCRSGSISAIGAGIGTVFAVYVRLTVRQQDHKLLVSGAAVAGGIQGFVALD